MVLKKKYRGGLKVLLLLLFIMLLNTYSICYATSPENLLVENMTISDLGAIYNHIAELDIGLSSDYKTFISTRSSNTSQLTSDLNTLKSNIPTGTSIYSLNIAISIGRNYQDWVLIVFYVNNNQISNSLPYIKAIEETPYYFTPTYINDDLSNYSGLSFKAVLSSKKNGTSATFTTQTVSEISINSLSTSTISDVVVYIPYFFGLRETNRESSYYVAMQDLYYKWGTNTDFKWVKNQHSVELPSFVYELPPEEPSGDVSGDSSGDSSGDIPSGGFIDYTNQLNNINNSINTQGENIVNAISGETQKVINTLTNVPSLSGETISSGDIIDALGFEFETDRYANFWYELTQGLKNSLLGSKRSIDVIFQNNTYTISLDNNFAILPAWLQIILTPFTTCFLVWKLVKWWKLIIDKISSGNVDSLLKDNAEEGISNLF